MKKILKLEKINTEKEDEASMNCCQKFQKYLWKKWEVIRPYAKSATEIIDFSKDLYYNVTVQH